MLTGESLPVDKSADPPRSGWDDPAKRIAAVFSGTLVVHGHGVAEVVATGPRTEIGRIGSALVSIETEATPLQRETRRVVRVLAMAGLALCAIVAIVYGVLRGDWAEAILAGITLAMGYCRRSFPSS